MEDFFINAEEWIANKQECINLIKQGKIKTFSRKSVGGFEGTYLNWLNVWKWMKQKYSNFVFNVLDIKTATEATGYIKAELIINNKNMGSLALNLQYYLDKNGKNVSETTEQLQLRVFVKLVANITGFGIHLWEK